MVVWNFLKSYWKYVVMGILFLIIVALSIVVTVLRNKVSDSSKKDYKQEQKELDKKVDEGKKAAQEQIDSGLIQYKEGEKLEVKAKEKRKKTKEVEDETYKEVFAVDSLNRDSVAGEFARLSEEYNQSLRRLSKDTN